MRQQLAAGIHPVSNLSTAASIGTQAPIKLPPSVKQTPKVMIGAKPVKPSGKVQDYEGGYKDWKKAQDNYKRELKEWKSIKPLHKPDDKRANQINQAGMERGVAANATTIVNAPTSTVVDNKQSNTTISSTSFGHSNPALVAVNMAT